MSDAPNQQQQNIEGAALAQQDDARMHANLAQYTRALHDYTLTLWTESRRVAQEKEKMMRERHAAMVSPAGLPASSSQPTPTPTKPHATLPATSAPTSMPTQSVVDDTTPKAVTPPKSNPVDSALKTPTPPPASS